MGSCRRLKPTSRHPPHYACVNSLEERHLHLARLFSQTVLYFEQPVRVQSAALAKLCPAVTVECGRAGEQAGAPQGCPAHHVVPAPIATAKCARAEAPASKLPGVRRRKSSLGADASLP